MPSTVGGKIVQDTEVTSSLVAVSGPSAVKSPTSRGSSCSPGPAGRGGRCLPGSARSRIPRWSPTMPAIPSCPSSTPGRPSSRRSSSADRPTNRSTRSGRRPTNRGRRSRSSLPRWRRRPSRCRPWGPARRSNPRRNGRWPGTEPGDRDDLLSSWNPSLGRGPSRPCRRRSLSSLEELLRGKSPHRLVFLWQFGPAFRLEV